MNCNALGSSRHLIIIYWDSDKCMTKRMVANLDLLIKALYATLIMMMI